MSYSLKTKCIQLSFNLRIFLRLPNDKQKAQEKQLAYYNHFKKILSECEVLIVTYGQTEVWSHKDAPDTAFYAAPFVGIKDGDQNHICKDLTLDEKSISIEVKQEPGVTYQIDFIGCRKGKTAPEELKSAEGNKASFAITNDLLFVRCKITSSKLHENPIEDLIYETAWTQPVLVAMNK